MWLRDAKRACARHWSSKVPATIEWTLTVAQARALYDRLGAKQDNHGFYEDHALSTLTDHAAFYTAASVFEFGCGTGRFAEQLLAEVLPPSSRYVGVYISSTMVNLARERLRRWPDRTRVRLSDGSPVLSAADGSFDCVVSNYVLDLLSEDDISTFLAEAARILSEDGRLCLVSLTHGQGPFPRLVSLAWKQLHALRPQLVGGCRLIRLLDLLPAARWRIVYWEVVSAFGISSEVVVASRPPLP
jgi:ubiquinone/menaquinone biosynthesis C-methylase UbiE